MRKITIAISSCLLLLLIGGTTMLTDTPNLFDGPYISGCIGECNESFSDSYTITMGDKWATCGGALCDLTFYTSDGVCENTGVQIVVAKNGNTLWSYYFIDDVNYSVPFSHYIDANADVGDVISVTASMSSSGQQVTCKRLGFFNFDIEGS